MNLKTVLAAAVALAFAVPLAAQADGASASASAMFKDLDKNKDGFISREEAKGSPHEQQFDQLDKNADGKLSRAEHAAAHRAKASAGGSAEASTSTRSAPPSEKKY